jgi:KDO2-lipid IV(A) lauroyltransferase
VVTEFLGAEAHVDRAPAALAAIAGCPLIVAAARREGDRHVLHVLDVMEPGPNGTRGFVQDATIRATRALEAFVRQHPAEWLWLHRRWKVPLDCARAHEPGTRPARHRR